MLKHLYKNTLFLAIGFLSFQKSNAQQCPSANTFVSNDTICSGIDSATVFLSDVKIGAYYRAYLGTQILDSALAKGTNLSLRISAKKLTIGNNKLTIKASFTGCAVVTLLDSAIIKVNQAPRIDQRVVGDTICDNATSATIAIYGTLPGESYEATLNGMTIGQMLAKNDVLFLVIPRTGLSLGINTITIKASVSGCVTSTLIKQAIVLVNSIAMPAVGFSVKGDTICSTNPLAKITITPTSKLLQYQIFMGTRALTNLFYGDSAKDFTVKKISTEELSVGQNLITVKTNINMGICGGIVSFKSTATVVINQAPEIPKLKLIGDTVFITEKMAIVKIQNVVFGVGYSIQGSQKADTTIVAAGNTIELKIPVGGTNGLPVGTHKISVNAAIAGCVNTVIRDSTFVVVKKDPTLFNENYFINSNFSVWPNPFSSELHVSSKLTGNVNVQIVDALGNVMHQQTVSANEEIKINPDLKNGLYFLQMESDGKRELVKLIKQ